MSASEPFFTDRGALKRRFGRAARTFERADTLYREISARMLERFDVIRIEPVRILDLGCGTGGAAPGLQERFRRARWTGLDLSPAMLRRAAPRVPAWRRLLPGAPARQAVCGDMGALPFRDGAFDLVWSNLALHWMDDPLPALKEAGRVLAAGGLMMFSTFGPDTLRELRAAFAAASPGWHVRRFIDLHDLGDALGKAGFAAQVMDMEMVTLTYADLDGLFADLRMTGATNAMLGRRRGLTGRDLFGRVRLAYEDCRTAGRLPATFEIVYGHAWRALPRSAGPREAPVRFMPRRRDGSPGLE